MCAVVDAVRLLLKKKKKSLDSFFSADGFGTTSLAKSGEKQLSMKQGSVFF